MVYVQNNDSGANTVLIVVVLLILVALVAWVFGGFNFLSTQNNPDSPNNIRINVDMPTQDRTNPTPVTPPAPTPIDPAPIDTTTTGGTTTGGVTTSGTTTAQ